MHAGKGLTARAGIVSPLVALLIALTAQALPARAAASVPAASALPIVAATERASWYACLEDYAQVAMASTGTTATIAIQTEQACGAERKAYHVALWRSRTISGDATALAARFAAEDRAAYEHVIGFVERLR
jgi:xanthine/uracil/vitamin C permease (AzgA family)